MMEELKKSDDWKCKKKCVNSSELQKMQQVSACHFSSLFFFYPSTERCLFS